jgi:hypothetical protein
LLLYVDFDPSVSRIVAQPFLLKSAAVESVTRQHIPDYLLITDRGSVVVDVKPKDRMKDGVVADTLAWTRAANEQRGWGYEVHPFTRSAFAVSAIVGAAACFAGLAAAGDRVRLRMSPKQSINRSFLRMRSSLC